MKKSLPLLVFIFLILILIGGYFKNQSRKKGPPPFITSNPLDLSQIESISTLRSCVGHDYSPEDESLRSMKHYLEPVDTLTNTSGLVKAYAPFTGTIAEIDQDCGPESVCRGVQVWLEPDYYPEWYFIFFHIDLLEGLSENSKVTAGELIGYADLENAGNFDMAFKGTDPLKGPNIYSSPFLFMNEPILSEYSAVGVTPENIILSKEYRDNNPCPTIRSTESKNDTVFPGEEDGERPFDWVHLTNNQ